MPSISIRGLKLGCPAPDFLLLEPKTGKTLSLAAVAGKPVLIAFITNDCMTVNLIREEFVDFAHEYQQKGLEVIAINPNEGKGKAEMMMDIAQYHYSFPYLFDATQAVAKAYQVVCTPDFFIFDANHRLYYLGQFDDARPNNGQPVNGNDIRLAANALLKGDACPIEQKPSSGCSIMWHENSENLLLQNSIF